MCLPHLLSELLVTSVLNCVDLESMRVAVDIMVLSEHVRDRVQCGHDSADHVDDDFGIWHLVFGNK